MQPIKPHQCVIYLDHSALRRKALSQHLKLARRDLDIRCCDLMQARAELRKGDPLTAMVVYAIGWGSKKGLLDSVLKTARQAQIPTLYAMGNETVTRLNRSDLTSGKHIIYRNPLDLSDRIQEALSQENN